MRISSIVPRSGNLPLLPVVAVFSMVCAVFALLAGADFASAANPADFDTSFGLAGLVTTTYGFPYGGYSDLLIQPDGKIVAVGAGSFD